MVVDATSEGKIVVVKLMSGQEFIGKVLNVNEQSISVAVPLTLQAMRNEASSPQGKASIGVGFIPFSWGAKAVSVNINREHVTAVMEPEDDLRNQYATITGDIVIATPRIQLA